MFQGAAVRPLRMVATHGANTYMRFFTATPYTAYYMLYVAGLHRTDVTRLMAPVRIALFPVGRQCQLQGLAIHLQYNEH